MSEYQMTDYERQSLQEILDKKNVEIPLENFPQMQTIQKPTMKNNKSNKQGSSLRSTNNEFYNSSNKQNSSFVATSQQNQLRSSLPAEQEQFHNTFTNSRHRHHYSTSVNLHQGLSQPMLFEHQAQFQEQLQSNQQAHYIPPNN